MLSSYKIEGIIIKRSDFGEADKILTIFSKDHGKIKAIAKGVRKIKSRRASHLELFNHTKITLHRGKNFDIVTEAEMIASYNFLKKDLKRVAAAYFIAELIDKLCPDHQEHNEIFFQFQIKLAHLNSDDSPNLNEEINNFTRSILVNLGFLAPETRLVGEKLFNFIEEIIERKLNTKALLTKINL